MGNWKRGGIFPPRFFFCRKGRIMEDLKIYRISDRYIRYMHSHDSRVQYNKKQRRPYVGVVLRVNRYQYFVPMESPRPNHVNLKAGHHIFKLSGGKLGILGFNNMLPVPECALSIVDINAEADPQYKSLLQHQSRVIHNSTAAILQRAIRTYSDVINQKSSFLCGISCDFNALERACDAYQP